MRQWHPLFASLLRPAVAPYYELRTEVPVGEVPRSADIVLLRRILRRSPPFHGIWQFLSLWNVLEFKGPSVSPRIRDIDLLIELGLGIDRRLNEERTSRGEKILNRSDVSFWYLCRHLGRHFLRQAEQLLPGMANLVPGVWRCEHLGRPVYLVSSSQLPVEEDSVPIHLVSQRPDTEAAVARLIVEQEQLWNAYAGWLAMLHPAVVAEVATMAQRLGRKLPVDFRPAIERFGLATVIDQVGLDKVIAEVGLDKVIAEVGLDKVIAEVGLDKVIAEVGLDKVIAEVGLDKVIAEVGLDKVIAEVGLDKVIAEVGLDKVIAEVGLDKVIAEVGAERVIAELGLERLIAGVDKNVLMDKLLEQLSAAQRRQLKRRLEGNA